MFNDTQIPEICETEYEKDLSDRELKKECFQYARKNFQGRLFKNDNSGHSILVSRDGLDKWNNVTKSREQSMSIKVLDKLLENGILLKQSCDNYERRNVEGFIYFSAYCKVNELNYNAIIAVKQTKDNLDKFYHYYLKNIEIEPRSGYGTSSENPR